MTKFATLHSRQGRQSLQDLHAHVGQDSTIELDPIMGGDQSIDLGVELEGSHKPTCVAGSHALRYLWAWP